MSTLAPILIASPVRRSGTTLLQRLLCSADNALIYGESCVNELQILINMAQQRQLFFQSSRQFRDEMLQGVLNGEVNNWIPDLMPDMEGYLAAIMPRYLSILEHYRDFAQTQGRPNWGMKLPEWMAPQLLQTMAALPEAKLLYINRALLDCVRSARSIEMIINAQEIQQFCQTWQFNLKTIQNQADPSRCLIVDYDELLQRPDELLRQIEAFTGVQGIQSSVLKHRINTYKSDTRRDPSGQGYLPPAELSEAEVQIVQRFLPTN